MKRLLTLTVIIALVIGSTSVVTTGSASAQTQAQATACFNSYDNSKTNRSYADGSAEYRQAVAAVRQANCLNETGGNCSSQATSSSGRAFKIVCSTTPGGTPDDPLNPAANDGSANIDDEDDGPQLETVTDPAIAASANCNGVSCGIIANYINPAITLLTVLVGLAIVIGIIIGGLQIMTSAGDPQLNAKGKEHIRNALIAAVSYVLIFALLQWLIPGGIGS